MDAGPGLNFFSINRERLLFDVVTAVSVPETVKSEIERKSRSDGRFEAAKTVMAKLPEHLFAVLSDDEGDPALNRVVYRMTRARLSTRRMEANDLGELMVFAHAVRIAEQGDDVAVLIDDGPGVKRAVPEIRRLQMLASRGQSVGQIKLISTVGVLERAIGAKHIPTKGEMKSIYSKLRKLDDGLMPIERTSLLGSNRWDEFSRGHNQS